MLNKIIGLIKNDRPANADERFTRVQVATCALLLEVAHSDGQYHDVEEQIMHDLLSGMFSLPPDTVAELVDFARDHQQNSTDLFLFAREINAHFSADEKLAVMEGVWRLIYADGTLDKFEDSIARQLATLLRLSHKEAIACKVKVLEESRQKQEG
jgi:uncharacterized tellurite resistance protein B-like protein